MTKNLLPNFEEAKLCDSDVVHTIGYEKQSISSFISRLKVCGVDTVIDVRANPISRIPTFTGKTLRTHLTAAGIQYRPFPRLGIPSPIRRKITDRGELLDYYDREILPNVTDDLERVRDLCRAFRPVLLCYEADPFQCHRSRIARYLNLHDGLKVNHLRRA